MLIEPHSCHFSSSMKWLCNVFQDDLNRAVGTRDIPSDVTTAVRNNGGGHWNHSFFWKILAPAESKDADYQAAASDELKQAIEEGWGSLKDFEAKFNEAATAVFGSGWAWLGINDSGKLVITTTSEFPLHPGPVYQRPNSYNLA